MLASQAVEGEGSGQPSEPQHTPTTASPSHSSGPTTLVAKRDFQEGEGNSVERVATTAAKLRLQTGHESSNIPTIPPLSRVNTLGSGEDNMKLNELMEICIRLSERVLALEIIKTAQNLEIINLKKRVKKLENKKKARTPQLKRRLFKGRNGIDHDEEISWFQEDAKTQGSALVTTAGVSVSTSEPSTPPTTTILIEDKDLTIAQTLMKIRSVKSKEKSKEKGVSCETTIRPTRGVIMKEASETFTRPIVPPQKQLDPKDKGKCIIQEPEKPVKVKGKDQIAFDEEVARRLEAQMQAEYEEEERVAIQTEEEDNLISWDNTQAMMEADYELAQRLQAEEQEELTIEERSRLFIKLMDKRKNHFAKLRAKEIRRKPPTKAQKRNQMSTYLRNMAGYKHTQLKNKSFEEIQMLFDKEMKRVNSFVPMDSEVVEGSGKKTESSRKETVSKKRAGEELDEESVKRQKLEDDAEKAELQLCLEIVPRDDEAVNVESLSTKYPIVDWKTHILAEDKMYYQIIRADGSEKYYKIFSAMLDDFDRQDVLDLYRLVKERFETASPEGYDRLLWGDLITLFEPSEEDEIWKA
ncbi:hypothetical protein Tco_1044136 [Tanacetum coccineum]|uniref:Uncharacterized protein n=1 Tax=Tanacetum coccineum TaxID=301880 RepID=A0ABQ5GQA5_9ASTR